MPVMEYHTPESDVKDIENRFKSHQVSSDQIDRMSAVREHCKLTAMKILRYCPPSREKSLALTKLEEAMMHANASIARCENAAT